jgi:hypothetical protein
MRLERERKKREGGTLIIEYCSGVPKGVSKFINQVIEEAPDEKRIDQFYDFVFDFSSCGLSKSMPFFRSSNGKDCNTNLPLIELLLSICFLPTTTTMHPG